MPWVQDCPKYEQGKRCEYREAGEFICGEKACLYEVGFVGAECIEDFGICQLETEEDLIAEFNKAKLDEVDKRLGIDMNDPKVQSWIQGKGD